MATTLGVSSIAEGDYGPDLAAREDSFAAYRVTGSERVWEPTSLGLAALDCPIRMSLELTYVRKRAAGSETLSVIRGQMDTLAAALDGQPPTWDTENKIGWCRCVEFRESNMDDYGEASGSWCSGSVTVDILFCQ